MRLSADKNDPGYNPNFRNYDAFLNGEKLEYCLTADEETGEAWQIIKTGKNTVKVDQDGELVYKRLTGKVEIRKID